MPALRRWRFGNVCLAWPGTPPPKKMQPLDMHRYALRYFFEPGSGICLWSANAAARERFTYAVELELLDLPPEVVSRGNALITQFNSSIDWNNPPGPSPWPEGQRAQFESQAQELLGMLQDSPGPEFEIRD